MRDKLEKYWDGFANMNPFVTVASVLDPRNKLQFAALCFNQLYGKEMARDVLAIQVSSVALESAFSTSGRVLDPYRSSLTLYMIEVLVCTQHWLRCAFKSQEEAATVLEMLAEVEFLDSLVILVGKEESWSETFWLDPTFVEEAALLSILCSLPLPTCLRFNYSIN